MNILIIPVLSYLYSVQNAEECISIHDSVNFWRFADRASLYICLSI